MDVSSLFVARFLPEFSTKIGREFPPGLGTGANQLVHWFFGGKGLGIQQGMSVWVGSPESWFG